MSREEGHGGVGDEYRRKGRGYMTQECPGVYGSWQVTRAIDHGWCGGAEGEGVGTGWGWGGS